MMSETFVHTITIDDQFKGNWCWGQGPYVDWCKENCKGFYRINKYSHYTINAAFELASDLNWFVLRWS